MKARPPPEYLNNEAKRIWFETLEFLLEIKTLPMVEGEKEFGLYCEAVAVLYTRPRNLGDENFQLIMDFSSKYGLNPASRARLGLLNLPD